MSKINIWYREYKILYLGRVFEGTLDITDGGKTTVARVISSILSVFIACLTYSCPYFMSCFRWIARRKMQSTFNKIQYTSENDYYNVRSDM